MSLTIIYQDKALPMLEFERDEGEGLEADAGYETPIPEGLTISEIAKMQRDLLMDELAILRPELTIVKPGHVLP